MVKNEEQMKRQSTVGEQYSEVKASRSRKIENTYFIERMDERMDETWMVKQINTNQCMGQRRQEQPRRQQEMGSDSIRTEMNEANVCTLQANAYNRDGKLIII